MSVKLVLTLLMMLPLTVFAEDVFDRINDCENQADYKGCVFKLLREFATHIKPTESGGDPSTDKEYSKGPRCLVGSRNGSGYGGVLQLNTPGLTVGLIRSFQIKEAITDLETKWKEFGCGEESKVNCYIDYGVVFVGTGPGIIEFWPKSSLPEIGGKWLPPKEFLKHLQNTVCL
jgi:hypothetical protein